MVAMQKEIILIIQLYASDGFRAGSQSHPAAAGQVAPRFILNVLCTALAYLTIHTHQHWTTLIDDLTLAFSKDIDQAFCLLQVLKYMANDCDNESIVIEDSLRQTYYACLDGAAREKIFKGIFE